VTIGADSLTHLPPIPQATQRFGRNPARTQLRFCFTGTWPLDAA
jgi:hypothetical protein